MKFRALLFLTAAVFFINGPANTEVSGFKDFLSSAINKFKQIIKEEFGGITSVITAAIDELDDVIQNEMEQATFASDDYRPFRYVQRLLKAQPYCKQLSFPAWILNKAAHGTMSRMGNTFYGQSKEMMLETMASLGSPLPRLSQPRPQRPDQPLPALSHDTCPWPSYYCHRHQKYRSLDGSCNNLNNPIWGRAFTPFQRFQIPDYGDGLSSLRENRDGRPLPSAREVSNAISPHKNIPHHLNTLALLQWGQFLDHDLTNTAVTQMATDPRSGESVDIDCGDDGCEANHDACAPISVPRNDPAFPRSRRCLQFVRSQAVPNLDCLMGAREQVNQITAYLDASNVYGSSLAETNNLRETGLNSGRLRLATHPINNRLKGVLPHNTQDNTCLNFDANRRCFAAGDRRVNEAGTLAVMHTIWVREHNRIHDNLQRVNRRWRSEKLFQETRKIVIAEMQHITFNEFLPAVLGPSILATPEYDIQLQKRGYYTGYDYLVNPSIANVFATAAFRFGHSLLTPIIEPLDEDNRIVHKNRFIHLSETFFRPSALFSNASDGELDGFIRTLRHMKVQSMDRYMTEEVTRHLFTDNPPHGLGTDLSSLNIQRGRDHGLPGYTAWRKWCGLSVPKTISQMRDIPSAARRQFGKVYRHVDDVDLFPAGIAELSEDHGLVGPTFGCIIGRQMSHLRRGDRFWYENNGANKFTDRQMSEIRKMSLGKVLCENGDNVQKIQPRVMEVASRSRANAEVPCHQLPDLDPSAWQD